MHSVLGKVKSLKVYSMIDVICATSTLDTPPPIPHIRANIKCTVNTLGANSSTSSFIVFSRLVRMLQILVAHWIRVVGKG